MSITSSVTTPSVVDYGLVSGLNTQSIIQAELEPYQEPVTNLQNEQSSLGSQVNDYQQINSDLSALQAAAAALSRPSGWDARSATSSDSTVATASAASGTPTGSINFTVSQLAAANSLVSSGTVSSTSQIVTSKSDFLVAQGAGQLGFSSLSASSNLTLGSHTISVTQSSAAASTTGDVALGNESSGIDITTGSNDTLDVTANGTAYSLTLAGSPTGGYSASGLLSAVNSAISSAGASGVLQAGYDSSGNLILSTVDQGSSQSLQVTGGDALSTLGLATTSQLTGTDAIVSVDGTNTTLSTVAAGASETLAGASGSSVTATVGPSSSQQYVNSSLLSVGSVTGTNVTTGSGSLADVVSNINAAGTGVTASAIQTGTNQYVLQLSSSTTGTAANLSVDMNAFSTSSLGAMKTAVAGANAQIQIGGTTGYTVSSQNDTFSGLLPGLSITAQQVSTTPVSITVANDSSAVANSVQSLVNSANAALSDVQKYAGYNAATKTGGPLMGSATLENVTNEILGIFASTTGTSTLGNALNTGISISNGQISLNQSDFEKAFNANPSEVQAMFTQGGSFNPTSSADTGQVTFSYASNTTAEGSYDVNVTQSASQASTSGATLSSGSVSSAETLGITMGGSNVSFATSAGQSLTSIAAGLNAAFASQSMSLSAQVVNGTSLQLVSDDYGSDASFTVTTNNTAAGTLGLTGGTASATYSGTDVAGTINGVAATGSGQFLSAPASDPTLGGLSLMVTTPGITSATDLGTYSYTPGIAQALASFSNSMSAPVTGAISQTITGMQSQSARLTPQINWYSSIVSQQQQLLMAQYATMEENLGTIKNQASSLTSELAGITANGA
jgi:flagellar hook-associated protein 2